MTLRLPSAIRNWGQPSSSSSSAFLPCCFRRERDEEPPPQESPLPEVGSLRRRSFFLDHSASSEKLHDAYDIEDGVLGTGGFGTVRPARLKANRDLLRAVKEVRKKSLQAERVVRQEVAILRHLDHPCICRLFETYEDPKFIYLVMEYIDGRELFDEIQEDIINGISFDEHRAACIMQQVFGVLHYCHGLRVVHRDLKPENIMVLRAAGAAQGSTESTPQIKLIDFGLAAISKKREDCHTVLQVQGTAAYLAPESHKSGVYTTASDMWSTGIVLFIMLFGRFPGSRDKLKEDLGNGATSSTSSDLVAGLLKKDPKERLSAAQAMAHTWTCSNDDRMPATPGQLGSATSAFVEFHKSNQLQRAALTALAMQLSGQQFQTLGEQFRLMDTDGNGVITKDEFLEAVLASPPRGVVDVHSWVEAVFEDLDTDASGAIDFTEWEAGAVQSLSGVSEEAMQAAFRVFDVDNTGTISTEELCRIVAQSSEEMAASLKQFDLNGDGVIDFEEFKSMLGNPALLPRSSSNELLNSKNCSA